MDKKKLKVVDLDDLQPNNPQTKSSNSEEEVITPKIDLDQLDAQRIINQKQKESRILDRKNIAAKNHNKQNQTNENKIDISNITDSRLKKYKGSGTAESLANYMSRKYRFDKYRFKPLGPILAAGVFYIGFFLLDGQDETVKTAVDSIDALPHYVRNETVGAAGYYFKKYYFALIALILYFLPFRGYTKDMVEIFYDGLTIPSEIFPIGSTVRKRVLWRQIKKTNFKNKKGVDFIQLLGERGELLGEMRIDVAKLESFYRVLDRYLPENNPLRVLFQNT